MANGETLSASNEPYNPPNIFSPDFSQAQEPVQEQAPAQNQLQEQASEQQVQDQSQEQVPGRTERLPREVARPRGHTTNEAKMATDPQPAEPSPAPESEPAPQPAEQQPATPEAQYPEHLDGLDTDTLIYIANNADLSQYSIDELIAAKAKLEQDYIARYGEVYRSSRSTPEVQQPEAQQPAEQQQSPAAQQPETQQPADAQPETQPPVGEMSGIDVIVADNPDNSLETPTPTETDPAQGPTQDPEPDPTPAPEDIPTEETLEPTEVLPPTPGEHITPDQAQATLEKANQKQGIKGFFRRHAKSIAVAAIALATAGVIAIGVSTGHAVENPNPDQGTGQTTATQTGEQQEAQHGIKDGYNEKGMYESPAKAGAYDFAAASEVAEIKGDSAAEKIIYTAGNQSESMASYYAHVPDQLRPNFLKGITTISEMENRLESGTADEYDIAKMQFESIHRDGSTTYEKVTINGDFHNVYMAKKDANGDFVHENMQAVDCVTHENGTVVTKVTYHDADGNEIGTWYVKDGTCIQPIDQVGGPNEKIYIDITTITDNPPNPNPDTGSESTGDEGTGTENTGSESTGNEGTGNEDTGNEGTGNEDTGGEGTGGEGTGGEGTGSEGTDWGKDGDPNSGPNRLPSDLVDPGSEISQADNDAANQGNQGYVDDNQATPGSPSENNGTNANGFSNVITDGADTDGGRLSGGEQQGPNGLNGVNPNAPTPDQIAFDDAGNAAQQTVRDAGNTPGGDNNSDAQEVSRVAEGNF